MSTGTGNENQEAGNHSPRDIEIPLRDNEAFDAASLGGMSQGTTEVVGIHEELAELKAMVQQMYLASQSVSKEPAPKEVSTKEPSKEKVDSASLGYKLPKIEAPLFYGKTHNDLEGVIDWTYEAKIYMKDRFPEDEARWLEEVKLLLRGGARKWYEFTVDKRGMFTSWDQFTQAIYQTYAGAKRPAVLLKSFQSLTMKSTQEFDDHVESFYQLLHQLEIMGERTTDTHVFQVFVNSLTPGFKAKALQFEQDRLVKETTEPDTVDSCPLEGLIAYLYAWSSQLSSSLPSSSPPQITIHHVGGPKKKTKAKTNKAAYTDGLCTFCGARWDRTHLCDRLAAKWGK